MGSITTLPETCWESILQFTLQFRHGKNPPVLMACWWYANRGKIGFLISMAIWWEKPEGSCREGPLAISGISPKKFLVIELQFCPFRCSLYLRHTHTLFCAKKKMFYLLIKQQIHRSTGVVPVFLPPSPPTKTNGSNKPYITTKHLRFNGVRDLHPGNIT